MGNPHSPDEKEIAHEFGTSLIHIFEPSLATLLGSPTSVCTKFDHQFRCRQDWDWNSHSEVVEDPNPTRKPTRHSFFGGFGWGFGGAWGASGSSKSQLDVGQSFTPVQCQQEMDLLFRGCFSNVDYYKPFSHIFVMPSVFADSTEALFMATLTPDPQGPASWLVRACAGKRASCQKACRE